MHKLEQVRNVSVQGMLVTNSPCMSREARIKICPSVDNETYLVILKAYVR